MRQSIRTLFEPTFRFPNTRTIERVLFYWDVTSILICSSASEERESRCWEAQRQCCPSPVITQLINKKSTERRHNKQRAAAPVFCFCLLIKSFFFLQVCVDNCELCAAVQPRETTSGEKLARRRMPPLPLQLRHRAVGRSAKLSLPIEKIVASNVHQRTRNAPPRDHGWTPPKPLICQQRLGLRK